MEQQCAAILLAAGSARRMGGIDKMRAELGGVPVVRRSLLALTASPYIRSVVLVTRAELVDEMRRLCEGIPTLCAVVPGGEDRAASVRCGLAAVPKGFDLIAVHDGARPLVPREVIDAAVEKAAETGAAMPAVPVRDTIKQVREGRVLCTPDRAQLHCGQTPQVFERTLLTRALTEAQRRGLSVTDDASAVEALGRTVWVIPGSDENLKLTTPIDFRIAEAVLQERRKRDASRAWI